MSNPLHPRSLAELLAEAPEEAEVWAVDLEKQEIHRHLGHGQWTRAPVSTSRLGIGNEPDSHRTPAGWHRVAEVIGTGGPFDQEFISREPVPPSDREDRILSRILWLDGLEPTLNASSRERYIYIHGTNQVGQLSTPASMGCVRMDPEVLADWADAVTSGEIRVWIGTVI